MSYSDEWKELPLVTVAESDIIKDIKSDRVNDFYNYVKSERLKKQERESEAWWEMYNAYLKTKEWAAIRAKVLHRDNYKCQSCLVNKAVEVHHLTYYNVFEEHAFELVSVCSSCHARIHDKDKQTRKV